MNKKSQDNHELVTILIACYNDQKYILHAIKSLLNQTYPNWELIILDDGSTMSSHRLQSYIKGLKNVQYKRFSYNQGKAKILNQGLKMAKGKYILELDADDWLHKTAVESFISHARGISNSVAIIYSDYVTVKKIGKKSIKKLVKARPYINRMDWVKDIFVPTPRFYRKQALLDIGGWPTDYPSEGQLYEDLAIIFRLLNGYGMSYLPTATMYVRKRTDSVTYSNRRSFFPIYNFLLAKALKEWKENYNIYQMGSSAMNSTMIRLKESLNQSKKRAQVTLVIPFQNNEKTLPYVLQSIFTQNYPQFEIILINNHSSDESDAMIKPMINRQKNANHDIQRIENVGLPLAFNAVLELTKGKYLMVIKPYEILHPEAIEEMVNRLENYDGEKRIVGVYSDQKWFAVYPKWRYLKTCKNESLNKPEDLFKKDVYFGPVLFSVESMKETDGWPTNLIAEGKHGGELLMMGQLLKIGSFVRLPRVLSIHLQGDEEERRMQDYWQVKKVLLKKFKGFYQKQTSQELSPFDAPLLPNVLELEEGNSQV
ncbi:glycosyltransferase [Tepidibacillus marianensis]|uniref:glycosyltransferase family 2 protein n=1 Tax=Tepidibacillus marianensis TaxID=3131995 RepID=UPI0030D23251